MKSQAPTSLLFLTVLIVTIGCTSTGPSTQRQPSSGKTLELTLTSHRFLELEPCGCSLIDYGGMARELNLLTQNRRVVGSDNAWHFYTGVTFSPGPFGNAKLSASKLKKKQEILLTALNIIGPKALLLDADDFKYGVAQIESWRRMSHFPFLNASIISQSGKPHLAGHITAQWNGKTILITGISEPPTKAGFLPQGLTWRKPGAAMAATLKTAGNNFDLVIVLSTLNQLQRAEVLETVRGALPVLFLGGPRGALETASAQRESENSAYLNSMERGRAIGKIDLVWPAGDQRPVRIQSPYYAEPPQGVSVIDLASSMDGITKNFETPTNTIHGLIKKYREEMAFSARSSSPQMSSQGPKNHGVD